MGWGKTVWVLALSFFNFILLTLLLKGLEKSFLKFETLAFAALLILTLFAVEKHSKNTPGADAISTLLFSLALGNGAFLIAAKGFSLAAGGLLLVNLLGAIAGMALLEDVFEDEVKFEEKLKKREVKRKGKRK